jgi:methionyl-tRNA formyltransferase
MALREPDVKVVARELGLDVYQPEKVRNGELLEWLKKREPDVALVLAYGRILPEEVLAAPRIGSLNLHASLLPRYRGAAPIQWAIIRGESETGISLMQMDAGLDSGPVFSQHALPILPEETAGELAPRLAALAATVVRADLPRAVSGELVASPQDATAATLAPLLDRTHGRIDFRQPASTVHDLVRGLAPRPAAHTTAHGKPLRILSTRVASAAPRGLAPGEVRVERPRVLVGTGEGAIELVRAQLEGKRELAALELVNGRALADGDVLGAT